MRTKTLLLAAATLVAGISYSEAQNVYSQNVVGYVNVIFAGGGTNTLVATPLDNAGSNDLVSLLNNSLPNKSSVSIFDPVNGIETASKVSGVWNTNFDLPPGTGYFVKTPNTSGPITNTYVGNVINSTFGFGSTNTEALSTAIVLGGSVLPVAGTLNDSGPDTINLGSTLPNKSTVQTYDAVTGITTASKQSGIWNTNLTINVGEGFYISSKTATNWVQILQ